MSDSAIEIDQLEFAWPNAGTLLSVKHFSVGRGERLFLQGASGSGKSTLLGLIAGVLRPQYGAVRVAGQSLHALGAGELDRFRGEHVGFIFQMFNLVPYLSVLANVILPLHFSPARRSRLANVQPETEAARLLDTLGLPLSEVANRPVTQLSIGQQQRVAAARALIGRPDVLIADEPTSALDSEARADFLRLLLDECRQFGITLVFVSHDTSLSPFFDRALSMADINTAHAAVRGP